MNPIRQVSFALVLAIVSTASIAQTPASRFEAFLSNVAATTDSAFDDVFARSGIAESKPQALAALKAELKSRFPLWGKPLGFEKVSEKDISPSLKKLVYVQKFDKHLVVWVAYYYRAKEDWVANHILYSDDYSKVFNFYP